MKIFWLVLGLLLMGCPAVRADDCDATVVDGAAVFGSGIGQVNQAVLDLQRTGADVRVRTVPSLDGAGNLDRYEASLEKSCPSWQGADGRRKNTLVVFIAAVAEHKVAIYYGSQFSPVLSGEFLRIQTEVMNPHFRNRDFAGGFAAGLHEAQRLIVAANTPPPPPDYSGVWHVVIGVFVLAGVGVGAWFLSRSARERHAEAEKRRIAQQQARINKQAASNLVVRLQGATDTPGALVKALAPRVPDAELQPLTAKLVQASQLIIRATEAYGDADPTAGDPERAGLTVAEYGTMAAGYHQITEDLHAAERLIKEVEDQTRALEARVSS